MIVSDVDQNALIFFKDFNGSFPACFLITSSDISFIERRSLVLIDGSLHGRGGFGSYFEC